MLSLLVVALVTGQQAQCLSKYGKTVCGYGCVADYGLIKCAETPQGVCKADSGKITCWDPPGFRGQQPYAPALPEPGRFGGGRPAGANCVTEYGKTACGFSCVANAGQVACAQTPYGACVSNYGKVQCWDPPASHCVQGSAKAQCISDYGKLACGYACVSAYGQLACAESPQGACRAEYGKLVCWDPPHAWPGAPKASCVAEYGRIVCGYGCVADYGQIKCAQTPRGVCQSNAGTITCFDP
ncbi:MAG: hypothetical protein K1X89_05925 [Myxococcaceae bacterium]|nr:hypothetical protein [Myxococcaceae bacterium]